MNADVDRLLNRLDGEADFAAVLRESGVDARDSAVADIIEVDGRWRLRRGRGVTLERYLAAVPDLIDRPDALDAALEVSLRAMSGSSRIDAAAVTSLASRYPALADAIREAASLNAALWSTTGLRNRVTPRPVKTLPCDFGPTLPDGRRRYVLRELLGQGSFGQVYRAEDRQLSEESHAAEVAIKILSAVERTEHDRHRMIDEATKARRISHPNVVQVLDRGVIDDDEDFIVYEYVSGGDLGDRTANALPMSAARAASLMAQIARGVHAAHAAGVIHCDLKPSNVMLTRDGVPKVADFGIAVRLGEGRRSATGGEAYVRGPIGNIAFISPEQYRGEDAAFSVPSDVYALGGILFHLLTGALPNGSSREEIAARHDSAAPERSPPSARVLVPGVAPDLDAICACALATVPSERHESAAAFAEDLERWIQRRPIPRLHPTPRRRLVLWTRRKPGLAASVVAIIALAVGGAAVAGHFAREARRKAMDAEFAQLRVDEQAKNEALRRQLAAAVTTGVRDIGKEERFLTDMLMQVWVFESLFGPKVLGELELARQLWSNRIDAVQQMLEQRRARGLEDSIESLMWESALAFWLTSEGNHAEAVPLLEQNIERWSRVAEPNDPFVLELATLRQCALASRACDADAGWKDQAARTTALQSSSTALQAASKHLNDAHPRSPMHYLVLNRLADVHDPEGLNDPDRAAAYRREVRSLLDASQQKSTGVSQAVKATTSAIDGQAATRPANLPVPPR